MTTAPELTDHAAFGAPDGDRCIGHGYRYSYDHTNGHLAGMAAMVPLTIGNLRRDEDAGRARVCVGCKDGTDLAEAFTAPIRDLS